MATTGRVVLQISALIFVFIIGLASGVVIMDYQFHKIVPNSGISHLYYPKSNSSHPSDKGDKQTSEQDNETKQKTVIQHSHTYKPIRHPPTLEQTEKK